LEERAGERRPVTILDVAVRGDITAGCRATISGVLAEKDDLLSLPLSSKGGEGNGTAAIEHPDACKEQPTEALPGTAITFPPIALSYCPNTNKVLAGFDPKRHSLGMQKVRRKQRDAFDPATEDQSYECVPCSRRG
jgi:hypothetical protein